jgi:hypothetical protein
MNSIQLQLAVRRNAGRRMLADETAALSRNLQKEPTAIHFVDLETTDDIFRSFEAISDAARAGSTLIWERTWKESEIDTLKNTLTILSERVPDLPMYLHRRASECCGAVESSTKELFRYALNLIELDDEDLIAVTSDRSSVIYLTHISEKYSSYGTDIYQMGIWGDQLVNSLESAIEHLSCPSGAT